MNEDPKKELGRRLRERTTLLGAIAIDTIFVLVWLAIQVGANFVVGFLVPSADGLTRVLLWFLQGAFAIATAVPVTKSIYIDDIKGGTLDGEEEAKQLPKKAADDDTHENS